MTIGGRLEGLIIAGTTDPDGRGTMTDLLSTLGGLAAIAGSLLGPGLDARRQASDAAARIRQRIEQGAFRPVFQPIVDLASGDVVGYEALTRFTDGTPPAEMFAAAEAAGFGLELEAATLGEAIDAARPIPPDRWLELNASPRFVLAGEPLAGLLRSITRRLVLELTEHDAVTDYAAMRAAIGRLGPDLRLAVDDAGAGFASLRHILELRPHIVKLDRAVVAGIDTDPTRQGLVAGLQHFATTTNCTLLAEGLETAAEVRMVASLGVRFGQGYWFARPGPADEVVRLGPRLPAPSTPS
jgi:EAL domain-containing protein (putative c-di-GMP-specific phosphodiesterase class I)